MNLLRTKMMHVPTWDEPLDDIVRILSHNLVFSSTAQCSSYHARTDSAQKNPIHSAVDASPTDHIEFQCLSTSHGFTSDGRLQRFFPPTISKASNEGYKTHNYLHPIGNWYSVLKRLATATKALSRHLPAMLIRCVRNSTHNECTTCINGRETSPNWTRSCCSSKLSSTKWIRWW